MIAKRTFDVELIKSVMLHPDIFETVAEDGQEPGDFKINTDSEAWVLMFVGDDLIGVYVFHPHNSVTLEIHAHILPEFRKEHSIESGIMALKWFLENGNYKKLIAQVPSVYKNVKNFCLNNGFRVEGINRMSHKKDGQIMDLTLLGITRQEVEDFLK